MSWQMQIVHFNTKYGSYDEAVSRQDGLAIFVFLFKVSLVIRWILFGDIPCLWIWLDLYAFGFIWEKPRRCGDLCCSLTYTHPFNGPFSGTTQVGRYQKSKTNLDFTEARDSEWQWHPLGHMQVCTSLQTDNLASTPPLSFYRPDALPATQPTASKHVHTKNHMFYIST